MNESSENDKETEEYQPSKLVISLFGLGLILVVLSYVWSMYIALKLIPESTSMMIATIIGAIGWVLVAHTLIYGQFKTKNE